MAPNSLALARSTTKPRLLKRLSSRKATSSVAGRDADQVRYAVIELPVDGGETFGWIVDGIEMVFTSPSGKCKGEQHEFKLTSALNQVRYAVIELPVDGGETFGWLVDGVEMAFTSPSGKCKGEQHEFKLTSALNQVRYAVIELPVDGGNTFKWLVDGVEMVFTSPSGKCKGEQHEFKFTFGGGQVEYNPSAAPRALDVKVTDEIHVQKAVDEIYVVPITPLTDSIEETAVIAEPLAAQVDSTSTSVGDAASAELDEETMKAIDAALALNIQRSWLSKNMPSS